MGNDSAKHQRNLMETFLFILAVVATCLSLQIISALVLVCVALSLVTALGSANSSGTDQCQESATNNRRICRFIMGLFCVILSGFSWQRLHDENTFHCNAGSCKHATLVRGIWSMSTVLWLVYSVIMFTASSSYHEEDQDSESTRYSHEKALTIQDDAAELSNTENARSWIVHLWPAQY